MSLDFWTTTSEFLDTSILNDFATGKTGMTFEAKTDENSAWLMMATQAGPSPVISVWGPFLVEPEDVQDCVLDVVSSPKFVWQINVPMGAPDSAVQVAIELACFLAKKGRGAAYDLQQGRIFFPRPSLFSFFRPARRKVVAQPTVKIDLIKLEFFLPFSRVKAETASELLDILREFCPEAVPTRFGLFEPMQYRLHGGDDKSFRNLWTNELSTGHGGSFNWKSTAPSLDGQVFFSDRREMPPNPPSNYSRAHSLILSFDGRAASVPEWTGALVALFRELARRLNAFYAVGYVLRNLSLEKNTAGFIPNVSEYYSISTGRWWIGLSTNPTWLAWFGPGYAELVTPYLADCKFLKESSSTGVFLQMGLVPMNRDQLDNYPVLPDSLKVKENGMPAEVIPQVDTVL